MKIFNLNMKNKEREGGGEMRVLAFKFLFNNLHLKFHKHLNLRLKKME